MTTKVSAEVPQLQVKLGGQTISDQMMLELFEMEVENDLHLPDVATIKFHLNGIDGEATRIPDDTLKDALAQGTEIEISAPDSSNKFSPIFSGEVVAVSLEYSMWNDGGPMLAVVQAMDRSHQLHRGKHTKTFLNSKFSDIVSKVAKGHNLSAKVDATSGVHEYVLQSNQTDWEFLSDLASRIGYDLYVDAKDLYFKKPRQTAGSPVTLEWGQNLLQFHTRATTSSQVPSVTVRGWDWKQQKAIVGRQTSGEGSPQIGDSRKGTAQAKSAFGDSQVDVVDIQVATQGEADAMAKALADAIVSGHIYAEGVTVGGMGTILPRTQVDISGVGSRFSGTYYVTATTHRYNGWEGYTTTFVVGGRKPNTLAQEVDAGGKAMSAAPVVQGVAIGVVTNLDDPEDVGRIKVHFPWLSETQTGAKVESAWARIATPAAGTEQGFHWLPEINDEVLVAFDHGDINHPYIVGGLWNGKAAPPQKKADALSSGKVNTRMLKSKSGHVITLDDTSGSEQIIIRDKTEKNEIVIDSKNNAMSINVDKDMTIQAGGKVTVKCTGDMSLESSANMNIKASGNCSIEATGNMDIKGAQTTVEGTAKGEVKAPTVGLTGQAMAEVKASIVRIN